MVYIALAMLCVFVAMFLAYHDLRVKSDARESRLLSLLRDQWETNHMGHCGRDWPHPDGEECYWPPPDELKGREARTGLGNLFVGNRCVDVGGVIVYPDYHTTVSDNYIAAVEERA